MTKPEKKERWATVGWWTIWAVTFLISLLPPIVHHWRDIADIIEPLRYPWGLLPAELLFLRHLGELSHWVPVSLVGLLVLAIFKKQARRPIIAIGAMITAIFSSIYTAYCLIVVSMYMVGYTDATRSNQEAEKDSVPHKDNGEKMNAALAAIVQGDGDAHKKVLGVSTTVLRRIEANGLDAWGSAEAELDRISTWEERAVVKVISFYSVCSNSGRVYPYVDLGLELEKELEAVGATPTIKALNELKALEATGVELDDSGPTAKIEEQVPGDFEWAEPILEFIRKNPTRFLQNEVQEK